MKFGLFLILVVILTACKNNLPIEDGENVMIMNDTFVDQGEIDEIIISNYVVGFKEYKDYYTEFFICKNGNLTDTLSSFLHEGELTKKYLKDLNMDGIEDIVIQYSNNRTCNYIVLFYEDHYLVVDSCNNYPNLEPILIGNTNYYATYQNLGCASGIWETKLIAFDQNIVSVLCEARIDECDNYEIELFVYDDNLFKNSLKISTIVLPLSRDLASVWESILKSDPR